MTPEEQAEKRRAKAKYAADRRDRLKAEKKCVDCAEPRDGDYVRCAKCRSYIVDNMRLYRETPRAKRLDAKARKRRYRRLKKEKLCTICTKPAAPKRTLCPEHLASHCLWQAEYMDRKESGVGPVLQSATVEEPKEETVTERLLRAAARFDVFSNEDVREATGLESNRVSVELRRLRLKGAIELVRGGHGSNETAYRVVPTHWRAA